MQVEERHGKEKEILDWVYHRAGDIYHRIVSMRREGTKMYPLFEWFHADQLP